jgi:hypothetical protein
MHNFLNRLGLVDAWVCTNPDDPGYRHHTPSSNTVSRIDYVYCSHNFLDNIRSVNLPETSNFTFDHKFIGVNTCAEPSFNKDLCKEQSTAKKKARKRVFHSSNVDKEALINYRGIIHSRLQNKEQLEDPCEEWNRLEEIILKSAEIAILKRTTGPKKFPTIKTKFDQPIRTLRAIHRRKSNTN